MREYNENEKMIEALNKALVYKQEYASALEDFEDAVLVVSQAQYDIENIAIADRLHAILPGIIITGIFWVITSGQPSGKVWWGLTVAGVLTMIITLVLFATKSKDFFKFSAEYKSREQIYKAAEQNAIDYANDLNWVKVRMQMAAPFLSDAEVEPQKIEMLISYLEDGNALIL